MIDFVDSRTLELMKMRSLEFTVFSNIKPAFYQTGRENNIQTPTLQEMQVRMLMTQTVEVEAARKYLL